jgi:uncharacterized protein YdaU (DUF1376 family)
MKSDIWMPLYIGDYLADTIGLSLVEHGAYLMAIMAYWRKRGPLTQKEVDSIMLEQCSSLAKFFLIQDGIWTHKRIEAELLAAKSHSERAKRAANARWDAKPMLKPCSDDAKPMPSPSPSPSQYKEDIYRCSAPVSIPVVETSVLDVYNLLTPRLCRMYRRPEGSQISNGEEMRMLAEISKRPDVLNEVGIIEAFQFKLEDAGRGEYFPSSLSSLLSSWQKMCDRAANYRAPSAEPGGPKRIVEEFPTSGTASELKSKLADVFRRPPEQPWNRIEETAIAEIAMRPGCMLELSELLAFRPKRGKFFPSSILKLCQKWNETLDSSRNNNNHNPDKPVEKTMQDREIERLQRLVRKECQ